MSQEYIEIRGAHENNLKNISLRIPKRKITIFTGVSGSGRLFYANTRIRS
jgi:excinuclease UvrABC ATPase subunit